MKREWHEEIVEEKSDEKTVILDKKIDIENNKGEMSESHKKNYVAVRGEEEDMGWDEIEDVGSGDEKKFSNNLSGSENGADLRKRSSVADDDEDLSWDIEDDDEPVKA